MAKKMYYSQDEAAEMLGVSVDELTNMVNEGELKAYQDGANIMFKAADIDQRSGGAAAEEEEIELSPADTTGVDAISLSDTDSLTIPKEDTTVLGEGVSIFDESDLGTIETTPDSLAKTQAAPTLDEQISLEGVGSGSGLLDLTRESDDTSLGAEVLEHINMDTAIGTSLGGEAIIEPEPFPAAEPEPAVAIQPVVIEQVDPSAGVFNGIIVGCAVVMVVLTAVALAAMGSELPGYLEFFADNITIVLIGGAVVIAVAALAGHMLGRAAVAKNQAAQQI